ncbi:protein of unknown function [Thauera humireducens]|nr:protein of unknown function [Thauera humireducens]
MSRSKRRRATSCVSSDNSTLTHASISSAPVSMCVLASTCLVTVRATPSPGGAGGFRDRRRALQIPFFMIKQSNDMISLIDGHDQRL